MSFEDSGSEKSRFYGFPTHELLSPRIYLKRNVINELKKLTELFIASLISH